MKRKWKYIIFSLVATAGLSACNKLDVVGDTSIKSFEKVINTIPNQITEEEAFGGWSLTAPDNEAKFMWSRDYSKSSEYDVKLEVNAEAFINAGLDVSKLPEGMYKDNIISVGTNLGEDAITYEGEVTPLKSYEKIVDLYRDSIGYHTALDHYGVELMNGNMFEWAKDMTKNDKDIVFVLDPKVFIDAGVNPENVEGWIFAKVETMNMSGKKVEVDKLLKPFDLDGKK